MAEYRFTFPCSCCGGGAFEFQCRSRDGTATLCGFDEWVASSPPRKFLRATASGSSTLTGVFSEFGAQGSGAYVYNPATCTVIQSDFIWCNIEVPARCDTSFDPCTGGANASANTGIGSWEETSRTPTVLTCRQTGNCCGGSGVVAGDGLSNTLSQEDTEEAAIARITSSWTEWGEGSCCTYKQPRGPGVFVFAFTESQYRIRVKGSPGELVNLVLGFTRSDGAPYEEMRQFVATGPEFGEWQEFTVQAAAGAVACLASVTRYIG